MRRNLITMTVLTLGLAGAGCSTGTSNFIVPTPLPTPNLAPPASDGSGTVVSPSGTLPPTGPPGVTGSVTHGQASLTLSGGLSQTVSFPTLGAPAIWSPTPGTMTLSWTGLDPAESISVGGPSFTGQQSTSSTLTLAFSVKTPKGPMSFRSQGGECTVTLNPAQPTQVGGLVFCTNLKSVDGSVTVNAQGSFTAVG
ncbi:MAG: hypothetical protein ABI828_02325 [Actinomycetota bacterium]